MRKEYNKDCFVVKSGYVDEDLKESGLLFDNLPEIIKPDVLARYLSVSVKTIYDWRYRGQTRNIPSNLFIKINRLLYIRKTVLLSWINSQNKELNYDN